MDSQYSGSLVGDDYSESSMETHAEDDSSIMTEERGENSFEEEQSSITTENSFEEEIDPWTTLINVRRSVQGPGSVQRLTIRLVVKKCNSYAIN